MQIQDKNRIQSIDLVRGIAIVLMALDHVRDFFHRDSFFFEATDLLQTSAAIFLTRFITHFCAPTFCFLAGCSAFMVGEKTNKKSLSAWLVKRGLWLVVLEITIINFGWTFNFYTGVIDLAVIWCLGISMIFLAAIIHLPKYVAIGLALLLVFGHNLFDGYQPAPIDIFGKIWHVLHLPGEFSIGSLTIIITYPIMPWIGLMTLGYFAGELYLPSFEAKKRRQILLSTGIFLLLMFLIFRISNLYGDPNPWQKQDNLFFTVLSVLNVQKYPPSFAFICITIGPACILLSIAEYCKNSLSKVLITFGQVPMFFYILHIYIIHFFAGILAALTGFRFSDMILQQWISQTENLKGYGVELSGVYLVWMGIVLMLYPLCYWFKRYKKNHRSQWWLAYL